MRRISFLIGISFAGAAMLMPIRAWAGNSIAAAKSAHLHAEILVDASAPTQRFGNPATTTIHHVGIIDVPLAVLVQAGEPEGPVPTAVANLKSNADMAAMAAQIESIIAKCNGDSGCEQSAAAQWAMTANPNRSAVNSIRNAKMPTVNFERYRVLYTDKSCGSAVVQVVDRVDGNIPIEDGEGARSGTRRFIQENKGTVTLDGGKDPRLPAYNLCSVSVKADTETHRYTLSIPANVAAELDHLEDAKEKGRAKVALLGQLPKEFVESSNIVLKDLQFSDGAPLSGTQDIPTAFDGVKAVAHIAWQVTF